MTSRELKIEKLIHGSFVHKREVLVDKGFGW